MMRNDAVFRSLLLPGILALGLAGGGCRMFSDRGSAEPASAVILQGFNSRPRLRLGSTAVAFWRTRFLDSELGTHGYYFKPKEKNGILYTCRGGHIDLAHLRIAADWTAYLAAKSYRCLMQDEPGFSYKLFADRSRHYVQISYPANWSTLSAPQRQGIAREVALTLGPYLAYTLVTWHEILTWHGFRSAGLMPEFHSAFSWEDSYSNLLGTIVASKALRDLEHSYDEALTLVLAQELQRLDVQPAAVARRASESVRGTWYTGRAGMSIDMRKRGFDIGWDDGLVTPVIVPEVSRCANTEPVSYPAPTLQGLSHHGFSAAVEIEPHEWEKNKILRIVYPDHRGRRIRPEAHFALILHHIRQEAVARYGPEVESSPAAAPAKSEPRLTRRDGSLIRDQAPN